MEYTKGEWRYFRLPEGWRIEESKGEQIAFSIPNEGNAHLIAAAPRLVDLLLESRQSIRGDWRERRDKVLKEAGLL